MIGKIHINGLIGSIGTEKGVELIDVISQVRKQPEATSFEVYINSEGGVVDTGFDIYNYLISLGLPITTIGQNLVASIATVIFMAGQKRIVSPNTDFMIHLPMGGIEYATAEEMEMHTKNLRSVESKIVDFYTKGLNINKEAISPLLKNETWLSQEQLIDLGFVTVSTEVKIAARYIKTNNKTDKKMSKKSKLKAFIDSLLDTEVVKEQEIVNKTIYTADSKELVFPEIEEDGEIVEGARATVDGQSAEGEIIDADGNIYIFEGGILQPSPVVEDEEIVEEEEEMISDEQMIESLVAAFELMTELSEEVKAIKKEFTALQEDKNNVDEKLKNAEVIIAKLKGSSAEPIEDKKEKELKKETVSDAVAQWKKRKTINK